MRNDCSIMLVLKIPAAELTEKENMQNLQHTKQYEII